MDKPSRTFNLLSDLDDLNYQIKCAISLVYMIQVAVESGRDRAEGEGVYSNALFGAYDYLDELNKRQEKLTEELHDEYFKSRGANS